MFSIEGFAFGVNYGLNKVRFPAPLPVGTRVRMRARLLSVEEIPGGAQISSEPVPVPLNRNKKGGQQATFVFVAE